MSQSEKFYSLNAADLRESFDQMFAAPVRPASDALESFLAIRVAGKPFALRLSELARMESTANVVPLPGSSSALLGLASIQGRLTPVFGLPQLLGLGTTQQAGQWIAVCSREEPWGVSVEELEGYLQIPKSEVLRVSGNQAMPHAVQGKGAIRPVLQIASLLAEVRKQIGVSRDA